MRVDFMLEIMYSHNTCNTRHWIIRRGSTVPTARNTCAVQTVNLCHAENHNEECVLECNRGLNKIRRMQRRRMKHETAEANGIEAREETLSSYTFIIRVQPILFGAHIMMALIMALKN